MKLTCPVIGVATCGYFNIDESINIESEVEIPIEYYIIGFKNINNPDFMPKINNDDKTDPKIFIKIDSLKDLSEEERKNSVFSTSNKKQSTAENIILDPAEYERRLRIHDLILC